MCMETESSASTESTLVVTDLDGTLWDQQKRCHPRTLRAIESLEGLGIELLVATGRRIGSAESGLAGNGLCLPTVLLNGAIGVDPLGDTEKPVSGSSIDRQIFHQRSFTDDQSSACLEVFESLDLSPCVYLADGRVAVGANLTSSSSHRNQMGDSLLMLEPREAASEFEILSFGFLGQPEATMRSAAAALDQAASTSNYSLYADRLHNQWSLTTQPPGISKREGIEAFIAYRSLGVDRLIVLGDGGNDLEMLEAADIAIGIEGGAPEALDLADLVLPRPAVGGWAGVLDVIA